jgi:hypothetical protein
LQLCQIFKTSASYLFCRDSFFHSGDETVTCT